VQHRVQSGEQHAGHDQRRDGEQHGATQAGEQQNRRGDQGAEGEPGVAAQSEHAHRPVTVTGGLACRPGGFGVERGDHEPG